MATHSVHSRPFPRGRTSKGEEIVILTWRDLEFFSQMHSEGGRYRTFCPIHGSDHQRSLSINTTNGFGQCFACETRVFVTEFDPLLAARLQRRGSGTIFPRQEHEHTRIPAAPSHPKKRVSLHDWQVEERQLLSTLQAQGALRLDRDAAWNAQAYLEARHIPVEVAIATGVGYLEPGASTLYGHHMQRWEDRLIFPLATPHSAEPDLIEGFAGRLLWHWQCCPDETAHKRYLEEQDRKRWIKTNPAGWFWEARHMPTSSPVIVVEGPFDRLAILAAGHFQADELIALVGTALQPEWLSGAQKVLVALDDDQGGRDASKRIEQKLRWNQVRVEVCSPTSNDAKDWSECWRKHGSSGLEALYAYHALLAHDL
jgi:DNA primase